MYFILFAAIMNGIAFLIFLSVSSLLAYKNATGIGQKEASTYNGIKVVYLINGVGKIGQIHAKNETSYTTHKNKFEMA